MMMIKGHECDSLKMNICSGTAKTDKVHNAVMDEVMNASQELKYEFTRLLDIEDREEVFPITTQ